MLVAALSLDAVRVEPAGVTAPDSMSPGGVSAGELMAAIDQPEAAAEVPAAGRPRWGALGFVLVQNGIAPTASLDVGAGLVARWPQPGLEPWLLLAVYAAAAPQTVRVGGASAQLDHVALRAVGCAWRYPSTGPVALRPCLGLDVGRCRGEGSGVSGVSSNSSLWLAARAELRLEFSIRDGLSIGAAGAAGVPLVRPRFYFEPGTLVFQAPALGSEASGFASWLF